MKKTVAIIFVSILTFVAFLGENPSASEFTAPSVASAAEPPLPVEDVDLEFEEYPFEDYYEGTYVETECQDCLISADLDCLDVHTDCLDLPDCSDWLTCVGWCEAYEGDDECYAQCDDAFIDKKEVESDLRNCACELCGMKCRALCGVEGY